MAGGSKRKRSKQMWSNRSVEIQKVLYIIANIRFGELDSKDVNQLLVLFAFQYVYLYWPNWLEHHGPTSNNN
jgi:hypothetical protein